MKSNIDLKTVEGFGDEWERFDQSALDGKEQRKIFEQYFSIFPWDLISAEAVGCDMGCGTGRWAKLVAPLVKTLYCVDPSSAINVAKRNLSENRNCVFLNEDIESCSLEFDSMDFGYSLGVLHHIPDTFLALSSCVKYVKPGAPFLLYIYYKFDNRPFWFRALWSLSEFGRKFISKLPYQARYWASQLIAAVVYWPLARTVRIFEKMGVAPSLVERMPLAIYRNLSFYTMRTDALDRFGTRLEQRFTKTEIKEMMERAGLENIVFSDRMPYWCAVGIKSGS